MSVATHPTMTRAASMFATIRGTRLERIEAYQPFEIEWRGAKVTGTAIADRYSASYQDGDRLTPWRIVPQHVQYAETRADVSDTARRAVHDQVTPIVAAWLETDEATAAYRQAIAKAIARTIRDERYSTDTARAQLVTFNDDLDADTRDRLKHACTLLDELLTIVAEA